MKIILFDLDGCISDDRARRHLAEARKFDEYHERFTEDPPMNKSVVIAAAQQAKIVFVTARPARYADATTHWLKRHFPEVRGPILLMRPEGNLLPSPALKRELIEGAGWEWFDILAAYDDREDVLSMYREAGIPEVRRLTYPGGVGEVLRSMGATFDERESIYGEAYIRFGEVAAALWPSGLTATTPADFARLGVTVQVISKILRYTNNPAGHKDSAHDLGVYAAMLERLTK